MHASQGAAARRSSWSGMVAADGKLPVPNFAAGGIATPADAALCMQLGAEAVFVGSGIFKSTDPDGPRPRHRPRRHALQGSEGAARGLRRPRRGDARPRRPLAARVRAAPEPRLVSAWPVAAGDGSPYAAVLALQGDFARHARALAALGARPRARPDGEGDRSRRRHLVLPGGESTTMLKLLARGRPRGGDPRVPRLRPADLRHLRRGHPARPRGPRPGAAHASALLDVDGRAQRLRPAARELHRRRSTARRSAPPPLEAVFIRAPVIRAVGPRVEVPGQARDAGAGPRGQRPRRHVPSRDGGGSAGAAVFPGDVRSIVGSPQWVYLRTMSTTIHIPDRLLAQVDRRAQELGLSRNRLILRAIERLIEQENTWSTSFLDELHRASGDREGRRALSQMRRAIARLRGPEPAPTGILGSPRDLRPARKRVPLPLVRCAHRARPETEMTPERMARILLRGEAEGARRAPRTGSGRAPR